MSSRRYSSFLLRFWTVISAEGETAAPALTLQVQHLQSGQTWRLDSLESLQQLLTQSVNGSVITVYEAGPGEKLNLANNSEN